MKRNNLILLLVIVGLGLIIGISRYQKQQDKPMTIKALSDSEEKVMKVVVMQKKMNDELKEEEHEDHEGHEAEGQTEAAEVLRIEVMKKDDQWLINEEQYLAETKKIDDLVQEVKRERRIDLISELGDDYNKYELDKEKATVIELYGEQGKLLRSYRLGKQSPNGNHIYFMKDKDKAVYQTGNSFNSVLETDVDMLREKILFSFIQGEAKTVEIKEAEEEAPLVISEVTITNQANKTNESDATTNSQTTLAWKDQNGKSYDMAKIKKILEILSSLKVDTFLDDTMESLKKEPMKRQFSVRVKSEIYELMILKDQMTLSEGKDEKKIYRLYSPHRKYGFTLMEKDIEVLLQAIADLYQQEST